MSLGGRPGGGPGGLIPTIMPDRGAAQTVGLLIKSNKNKSN